MKIVESNKAVGIILKEHIHAGSTLTKMKPYSVKIEQNTSGLGFDK